MNTRETAWDRFWNEIHRAGNVHPGGFTRWAVQFLRTAPSRTVVDLGVGPGRDLCFLLSEGFEVVGVDESKVAAEKATAAVAVLPADVRKRGRVVHAELVGYLKGLPAERTGAVHAAATYQALSEQNLQDAFTEVLRVLAPGGLHLWSIRNDRHAGARAPETVPPNFPDLGFTVPLRFFSHADIDRLTGERFERVAMQETELQSFYIADRKPR